MKSVSFSARSEWDDESPSTKRIASMMFDLPEPFGPETTVKPWEKGIRVFRANDLKLSISSSLMNKDAGP